MTREEFIAQAMIAMAPTVLIAWPHANNVLSVCDSAYTLASGLAAALERHEVAPWKNNPKQQGPPTPTQSLAHKRDADAALQSQRKAYHKEKNRG